MNDSKIRSTFDLKHKNLSPTLLNQISKILEQENIKDLFDLKDFADSMFEYLKQKGLLNDYSNWKRKQK